ncbi:hypothetical protein IMCC3317_14550 [Kordia antarctica]|uniref:START domain-containing protein n=1 Tax=Kordia antarctica TaxID=1218801 RepID=A0A7L4ZHZ2_9FLAO|nr:hypothetical protein [Kordia antarctica]QHI36101.1 hypothetical protein IMCC3317_14550 [Kordia antarctica]
MENDNQPKKPKKWKRILKYIGKGALILIGILFLYNWYWINSGSTEWQLEIDKDGVQIYSLKVPGDKVVKFRGVMKGKYTLSQLAAPHLKDHTLKTCIEWFPNCTGCEIIRPFDSIRQYDISLWTLDFPAPFQPRELLINTSVMQDENKVVTIDVVAVPNTIDHNEGKVRLERMHNVWKFTPLGNGMVECSQTQDVSFGGLFPFFMLNIIGVDANFEFMRDELPKFLEKEQYKNATFSFIEEQ